MELAHEIHLTLLLYFMLVLVDSGVYEQLRLSRLDGGATESIPIWKLVERHLI